MTVDIKLLLQKWGRKMFDESILRNEEKAVFALRNLYIQYNYRPFKMSKFEEYDLYSENKEFLVSEGVITFNDTNGKLLALKPDVTLSIIKNSKDISNGVEKFYYNENVYRISESSHTYKEIIQSGIECIGNIREKEVFEVSEIALKSLGLLNENYTLHIADIELLNALFDEYYVEQMMKNKILNAIVEKNLDKLKECTTEKQFHAFEILLKSYDSLYNNIFEIEKIVNSQKAIAAFSKLKEICFKLINAGYEDKIKIDFSIINQTSYYSGIVFKGYINGISNKVISGGQYDKLMNRMGKNSGALGFAVYLDAIERLGEKNDSSEDKMINIALPKGRLGEKVYSLFEKAGFDCPSIKEENRKLTFENKEKGLRFFWVKPSDVSIYVERGAADIGVVGKDILLEYEPDVFELLDLGIGKCKMAVAAKKDFVEDTSKTLRVATKFSNITKKYYANKCRDIDIIHLNGSIEIAPLLHLSDVIVDIVETGKTLLENNLVPFETITSISARLISNKASYSFKTKQIEKIKEGISEQVKSKND